ncbi:MAG: alpha/beta hydrolase [Planctomycetota bacterium]
MLSRRQALAATASLAATLPLPLHAASRQPHQRYTYRDGRVRLPSGRCLSYRDYGENLGAPLLLYFHGTPGSRLELGLCDREACDSGFRVIAVDRPGMGRSTYHSNRRITDWPCDIEALAAALGYDSQPFGIIGLSGGAPYAAVCAARIPHRLTHVAIVSGHAPMGACGTCPGNQDKFIELITRRPKLGQAALGLVDRRLDRKPDKTIQMLSKNWSAADRKLMLCNRKRYCQLLANLREATRCGTDGITTDIRLLGSCWGYCLGEISGTPVSIWQGGCDPVVTPSMGRYFHKQIAGSDLILDPRAGHVTMFKWHVHEILRRFAP